MSTAMRTILANARTRMLEEEEVARAAIAQDETEDLSGWVIHMESLPSSRFHRLLYQEELSPGKLAIVLREFYKRFLSDLKEKGPDPLPPPPPADLPPDPVDVALEESMKRLRESGIYTG